MKKRKIIKLSIILTLGLVIVATIVTQPTIVKALDFSKCPACDTGTGSVTTPGGVTVPDGTRDELAKKVLANKNITYDSNQNKIDIDPKTCYTAAKPNKKMASCVKKPVLQFLLAVANAGFKITVSCTIRDHPYMTAGGNVSRHSSGNAVDIGNEQIAPQLMPWIIKNLLGTDLAPRQVLCQGIKDKYIKSIDNMSISNKKVWPRFTSIYVGDHMDHIHVGY